MGRQPAEVIAKARRNTKPRVRTLNSRQWIVLRDKHKAHSRKRNAPCWYAEYGKCVLDGAPIDYDAKPQTAYAYETDHRKPRATHPHLMYVWSNLRASHCRCNRTHQHRSDSVVAQQDWIKPTF